MYRLFIITGMNNSGEQDRDMDEKLKDMAPLFENVEQLVHGF